MEYKILTHTSDKELSLIVTNAITDGWKVLGGLVVGNSKLYQVVSRGDYRSKKKK